MRRLRDVLGQEDLVHLRKILGEREDPTFNETKRRSRVNQISADDTYVADQALDPFQALSQGDRERLVSELVWRLTCHVEGSITRTPGKSIKLEFGFRMKSLVLDGRPIFCLVKPEGKGEA
jgi:hypothetical protein